MVANATAEFNDGGITRSRHSRSLPFPLAPAGGPRSWQSACSAAPPPRNRTWSQPRLVATGAVAVALLVPACGNRTTSGEEQASPTVVAPLADRLPQSLRDKGVIEVGSDIAYPPMEFKDDSGKTVGIDPDIAAAMGRQLGVEFRFENGTFDALILGLRSKRYDIAMTAMADTKNRQNGIDPKTGNKVSEGVDFVDYFLAGVSLYTRKGDHQGIKTWSDLCGRKVAVQRGTVPEDLTRKESRKCTSGGKTAIRIESFATDLEAQARLRSGGVDASHRLPRGRLHGKDVGRWHTLPASR